VGRALVRVPTFRLKTPVGRADPGAEMFWAARRHHALRTAGVACAVAVATAGVGGSGLSARALAAPGPGLLVAPLAGSGASGAVVPGPALASPLIAPGGVALDPAGDLYVADPGENRILRIAAGTGTLSVLAGTGTAGTPTPGPATASALNAPSGVAVDSSGDVYIADAGNHVVEEVSPGGTLSVVAGTGAAGTPVAGPATGSPLEAPTGVALDGAGDLFIADAGGSARHPSVDEVTPGGALSVLAGNGNYGLPVAGPARLSPLRTPRGLVVSPAGDVLVADPAANLVAEITPGGTLSVVAGSANGWAGAPSAGPASASRLSHPGALALDAAGDLYIADTANNRIEQVDPAGQLSILGGTGHTGRPAFGAAATASALWGPTGVAIGTDGEIDVALGADHSVEALVPPPPAVTVAPGLSGPARQGQTLTATSGSWAGIVNSETTGWERCASNGASCSSIPGASGPAYTLGAADVGHTVRALVTATGPTGSTSAPSPPSAVVLPLPPAVESLPQITGSAIDRGTLRVSTGTWSNSPTSVTDQWQSCDAGGGSCTDLAGATSTTYTLGPTDVGTTLRVLITAVNAGGKATADSVVSAVIAAASDPWANVAPPAETAPPIISGYTGGAVVGQTLSCSDGTWNGSPDSYSFFWSRGGIPIGGATSATYTITPDDRGYTLTCSVVAANAGGAIQADSYGVGVPGPRAGVPPVPTPPRTSTSASAARAARVTAASAHRRRAGRGRRVVKAGHRRRHPHRRYRRRHRHRHG
jgi:sugar lactone lactonase YvrE